MQRQSQGKTILVVEDEPRVRELAVAILSRRGYCILEAGIPADAIEIAATHAGPIDLLLTDVIMPGMNGADLYRQILQHRPGLRALFMSGYSGDMMAERGVKGPGVDFIPKPFSVEGLFQKVSAVLGRP